LFSTIVLKGDKLTTIILGGLILALTNAILKPIVTILSLPAIMLSLGLFTILINGFLVLVASWVYDPFEVETFGAAVLTGILIGLLNFILTRLLDKKSEESDV